MPECSKCGITQVSAEMRRSPKKDAEGRSLWLCKLTQPCKERRKQRRIHERAQKRAAASQR